MRIIDTARRAGRSLRQAKARTLLTSLGIAVGAFTIMTSIAAGEGARQYADKLISTNIDPQALFIVKDEGLVDPTQAQTGLKEYDPDATSEGGQTFTQLNKSDLEKLEKRTDITDVRPIYQTQVSYLTIEGFKKKYTNDVDVYNPDVQSEIAAGSLPKLGTDIANDEVIVPKSFAETLKVSEQSLIGKKITLVAERPAKLPSDEEIQKILMSEGPAGLKKLGASEVKKVTLKIRGVAKQAATSFSGTNTLQIPLEKATELNEFMTKGTKNYQKYFAVTAKAKNGEDPEAVKESLKDAGYAPQTAKDLQGFLFTIVNVLQSIVTGFGVLALMASVFGIINTQYISVLERTSQIGLMKALGMRGVSVWQLFLFEAMWIGFLGGVIGAGLSWAIGTAFNPTIAKLMDLSAGTDFLIYQFAPATMLVVGLMVIAALAGLLPSWKAARLDPIEALRTE
ncbi:MAG TPA: ABC transporter permease [Candidatus Saccharimonadales bacterium]